MLTSKQLADLIFPNVHGTIEELRERYGLTADAVTDRIERELGGF